jgi:enhancing lycopene biosynthesis protein 2
MKTTTKRVGLVLSGCGFLDGAEIHEATLALLALDRRDVEVLPFAPAGSFQVVDHARREKVEGERRELIAESARITRGTIQDLAQARAEGLDALLFPGGFGAAKNLSNFAAAGADLTVHPEVSRLILQMRQAQKPQGFICIAPVLAAKVLGAEGPLLTIGDDPGTAAAIERLGGRHQVCAVEEIAVDPRLKVVSTPAYMYPARISQVSAGIDRLVSALLELA